MAKHGAAQKHSDESAADRNHGRGQRRSEETAPRKSFPDQAGEADGKNRSKRGAYQIACLHHPLTSLTTKSTAPQGRNQNRNRHFHHEGREEHEVRN